MMMVVVVVMAMVMVMVLLMMMMALLMMMMLMMKPLGPNFECPEQKGFVGGCVAFSGVGLLSSVKVVNEPC